MPIDTCDRVLALLLAYFRRLTNCAGGIPAGGGTGDIGAVGIFTEARRGVALRDRRELGPALAEALTLGRSTALAEDSASGQLLDSAARVRAAVRALLYNTGCARCEVVREEDVTFLSSR